ncbi:hypothetical protein [Jonquetella anthropi]|uniref:hypothetical protein n=1 Tax=Jonquetella anthropi TaxID=428712 RepID=UPI0001B915CD|nr:hypothetical protein [Jonquetella anthropi]EEX48649.1 hypothetical protein GCWU000246_00675 [Jonquetella anthropi E3_33 E1]
MTWILSSIRWPPALYSVLKERAYQERRSVNSLAVEAVAKLLGVVDEKEGKK